MHHIQINRIKFLLIEQTAKKKKLINSLLARNQTILLVGTRLSRVVLGMEVTCNLHSKVKPLIYLIRMYNEHKKKYMHKLTDK
jgi:hypothetical protein